MVASTRILICCTVLLFAGCSTAFLTTSSKECILARSKHGIKSYCSSPSAIRTRRNSAAQGVGAVEMMASPLRLRSRFQETFSRFFANTRGILTAATVAACISTTAFAKPVFAKSAAELAMEVDQEADVNQVEIEYTGMRKLTPLENGIKYGGLIAVFGGGVVWSWREGRKEDREEEDRVKAEVERIEQWKKEFIDMEDVVADDDLQASLSKRVEEEKPASIDAEQLERLKRMFGEGGSKP